MSEILPAALAFLLTHFGLSVEPVRSLVIRAIGQNAFLAVYSVLALATFGYLVYLYTDVPRTTYLWLLNPDFYWPAKILMPLVCLFVFGGFLVRNPTQVGMQQLLQSGEYEAKGLLRITRHPLQWGIALWAITHIIANGDAVSVVFFAAFLLLSVIGTLHMDARKAAALGQDWHAFAAQTSNLPFLAILSGRNRLVLAELWQPALLAAVTYVALYWGHEWYAGVIVV